MKLWSDPYEAAAAADDDEGKSHLLYSDYNRAEHSPNPKYHRLTGSNCSCSDLVILHMGILKVCICVKFACCVVTEEK